MGSLKKKQGSKKKSIPKAEAEDENPYEKIEVNTTGTTQRLQNGTENLTHKKGFVNLKQSEDKNTLKKKKLPKNKSDEQRQEPKQSVKKFSQDDLENFRNNHAKSQGVLNIKNEEKKLSSENHKSVNSEEYNGSETQTKTKGVSQSTDTDITKMKNELKTLSQEYQSDKDENLTSTDTLTRKEKKSKAKKFNNQDLDNFRNDYAKQQGVTNDAKSEIIPKKNEKMVNEKTMDKPIIEKGDHDYVTKEKDKPRNSKEETKPKFTTQITRERLKEMESIDSAFSNTAYEKEQKRVDALMEKIQKERTAQEKEEKVKHTS